MAERINEGNSKTGSAKQVMKPHKASDTNPKPHSGDQVPQSNVKAPAKNHLFLRFRLINDKMTLIHSAVIEGDFEPNPHIYVGGLTFEALLNNTKLSYGSIADYGQTRSFADPNGGPERQGHSFGTLSYVDIPLRLPIKKLSLESLQKLQVNVYRVKAPVEKLHNLNVTPFAAESFSQQLRLVHSMKGIDLKSLPAEAVTQLRKHFSDK